MSQQQKLWRATLAARRAWKPPRAWVSPASRPNVSRSASLTVSMICRSACASGAGPRARAGGRSARAGRGPAPRSRPASGGGGRPRRSRRRPRPASRTGGRRGSALTSGSARRSRSSSPILARAPRYRASAPSPIDDVTFYLPSLGDWVTTGNGRSEVGKLSDYGRRQPIQSLGAGRERGGVPGRGATAGASGAGVRGPDPVQRCGPFRGPVGPKGEKPHPHALFNILVWGHVHGVRSSLIASTPIRLSNSGIMNRHE